MARESASTEQQCNASFTILFDEPLESRRMELRPFRSLRYSQDVVTRRGMSALIAPPSERISPELSARLLAAAPENIAHVLASETGAGETLKAWLAAGTLIKERRPGLWLYRQSRDSGDGTVVLNMLVGLVLLQDSTPDLVVPDTTPSAPARSRILGYLGETHVDLEPCLLLTRAPISAALSTTRGPDLSAVADGVRHDAFRIGDYAQHVELQGLVKNAEASLADGLDRYEAALQFSKAPAAAKLPGARFKLSAIAEEQSFGAAGAQALVNAGLFGVALGDPVY
jgi:hypothetical protein